MEPLRTPIATTTEFVTLSGLLERGWTRGKILSTLGAPDQEKRNPYYRSAAPMRLFRMDRVEAVERSPEWQAWHAASAERRVRLSTSARAVAAKKRATLVAETIERLEFFPPDMTTRAEVEEAARDMYVEHQIARREARNMDTFGLSAPTNETHLQRITVNALRHGASNYDYLCRDLAGRVGRAAAYAALRPRIDELVARWLMALPDGGSRIRTKPWGVLLEEVSASRQLVCVSLDGPMEEDLEDPLDEPVEQRLEQVLEEQQRRDPLRAEGVAS